MRAETVREVEVEVEAAEGSSGENAAVPSRLFSLVWLTLEATIAVMDEPGAPPPSELQLAGVDAMAGKKAGSLIEIYKPLLAEVARKSRAGEGSGYVITFAISVLALLMITVFVLLTIDDTPSGPPPPPVRAFNAGDDLDADGVVDVPECNSVTLGPLILDLQVQQKRAGRWGAQEQDSWDLAVRQALQLQVTLTDLEAFPEVEPEPEPEKGEHNEWYVGVFLSCFACLSNSFGYNFVRRSHALVAQRKIAGDMTAKSKDHWQFPLGWFCSIVLCAGLDTYALSFTDPALIAPLSGFTLVLNVWVAQLINHEKVYPIDGAVTALILSGVIVTIISGPSSKFAVVDSEYVWSHYFRTPWMAYELFMFGSAFIVTGWTKSLYGDQSPDGIAAGRKANPKLNAIAPILFPWIGAIFTAHMNVFVKAVSEYFKGPMPDVFTEAALYLCIIVLCVSVYIQLNAINDGLRTEGALTFVPIKCAFNVAQVSLASVTFFQTLDTMGTLQVYRYLLGLLMVIVGVLIITLRPDTEVDYEAQGGGGGLGESLTPRPEPAAGDGEPVEAPPQAQQVENQLHGSSSV